MRYPARHEEAVSSDAGVQAIQIRSGKPDDLPRDPLGDAAGWSIKTLEHDQHTFHGAIEATEGRSCVYVPLEFAGKIGRWEPGDGADK